MSLLALSLAAVLQTIPQDLATAMGDWGLCRGGYVGRHSGDEGTAEAIADRAMEACAEQERRTAEVARRHGRETEALVPRWRSEFRADMVVAVTEMRAGRAASDPSHAWGLCLGQHVIAAARRGDGASHQVMVDAAFAACRTLEEPLLREAIAEFGETNGRAALTEVRETVRRQLLTRLADGSLLAGQ